MQTNQHTPARPYGEGEKWHNTWSEGKREIPQPRATYRGAVGHAAVEWRGRVPNPDAVARIRAILDNPTVCDIAKCLFDLQVVQGHVPSPLLLPFALLALPRFATPWHAHTRIGNFTL